MVVISCSPRERQCPHSYHDRCITDPAFRGKNYTNCADLGYECDCDKVAIKFSFGPKLETAFKAKQQKRAARKRSRRQNKSRKNRKMSMGGRGNYQESKYQSLFYQNREYKIGDDVVISMPADQGGWGVARITGIHQKSDEQIPTFDVLWFWRATEVN